MHCKNSRLRLFIKNLGIPLISKVILNRIFYYNHYYYMSLYIPRLNNKTRIRRDIVLGRSKPQDWDILLQRLPHYSKNERKEILARYNFLQKGFFDSCFLGKNSNDEIVSMQCLIEPKHNEIINQRFSNVWPQLKNNEFMLEKLYIFPEFRKAGTFTTVNHLLLQIAGDKGYSVCRSFIRKDNIEALNGFLRLGFKIENLYTEINLLGRSWRGTNT